MPTLMEQTTEQKLGSEVILTFLDNFSEVPELLNQFSDSLVLIYEDVAKSKEFSSKAFNICQDIFTKWEKNDTSIDREVVRCCLDLWFTILGEEYELVDFLEVTSNLIIQEVDVKNSTQKGIERLEFNPITHEVIKNPLSNLILEEVEVTDFINPNEL